MPIQPHSLEQALCEAILALTMSILTSDPPTMHYPGFAWCPDIPNQQPNNIIEKYHT